MSRRSLRATGLAVLALLIVVSPAGAASHPTVSYLDIESQVMCVACHEALAVAQSPEAFSERQFIKDQIAGGYTEKQILNQMVAQYGQAVLAKPPAHGFNLLIYILPPAILIIGVGMLIYTLPRWKARSRAAAGTPMATAAPLDAEDERRLDEDLARQT